MDKKLIENLLIDIKTMKENAAISSKEKANAELFGRFIIKLEPVKNLFSEKVIQMVGDYTRILPGLATNHISIHTITHLAEHLRPQLENELEAYYKTL